MKRRWNKPFLAAAAAVTFLATGCGGQTVNQSQAQMNDAEAEIDLSTGAAAEQEETTSVSEAVTTVPEATTIPDVTSGTTCTTVETDFATVESLLNNMTLDEKIYQLFIVTPEALTGFGGSVTQAGDMTKTALETVPVGGLIYFAQNLESWQQTYDMLSLSQQYAQEAHNGIGLFTAVDEEGGFVARVSQKIGTYSSYDMEYYGTNLDYDGVYNVGSTIGNSLRELGFNVDFAPVADVNISSTNELGSRIFSSDPYVVSDMAAQFVLGVEGAGVSSTLKHFPGLGAGSGNTHNSSVVIDRTHSQLSETEFVAFQGGIEAGADFVMVGHQITTASLDNCPGDLSRTVVTDWLKNELGFTGLIVTDSHSMGAITENYTPGDAAVMAIQAGIDIILMPYDLTNAVVGIRTAVDSGEITEERIDESVRKILSKKFDMGVIAVESGETTTETIQ